MGRNILKEVQELTYLKLDKSKALPDLGKLVLNSKHKDTVIAFELQDYYIYKDKPDECQILGAIKTSLLKTTYDNLENVEGYMYSIFCDLKIGEKIAKDRPRLFKCKLSPDEKYIDANNLEVVPFRLIEVLG